MSDAEQVIRASITELLERRGAAADALTADSRLAEDLGMDSLELAELSAALEDALGSDPYSDGLVPATVGELVGYYAAG